MSVAHGIAQPRHQLRAVQRRSPGARRGRRDQSCRPRRPASAPPLRAATTSGPPGSVASTISFAASAKKNTMPDVVDGEMQRVREPFVRLVLEVRPDERRPAVPATSSSELSMTKAQSAARGQVVGSGVERTIQPILWTLRKLASWRVSPALTLTNTTTDPAGRMPRSRSIRFEPLDVALVGHERRDAPATARASPRHARSRWRHRSAPRGRSADSSRAVLPSRVTATIASASPAAASVTAASQSARP